MNSIAIYSNGNLTQNQQELLLNLAQVGNAVIVVHGTVDEYRRIRNVELSILNRIFTAPRVWSLPEHLTEEDYVTYSERIRAAKVAAFEQLRLGNYDCIYSREIDFNVMKNEPEWLNA